MVVNPYDIIRKKLYELEKKITNKKTTRPSLINELKRLYDISNVNVNRYGCDLPKYWQALKSTYIAKELKKNLLPLELSSDESNKLKFNNQQPNNRQPDLDCCIKVVYKPSTQFQDKSFGIEYGGGSSIWGEFVVFFSKDRLCGLAFTNKGENDLVVSDYQQRWSKFTYRENNRAAIIDNLQHILNGETKFEYPFLKLLLIGSPFQIKVWRALLSIPKGYLISYSHLAKLAGSPNAIRAVGTAIGRNPISYIVPCHRIIRDNGVLSGYRWGRQRKRMLIASELSH